jgi:L-rhamnose mutarotase
MKNTVYLAWYSLWDFDSENYIFGAFRTREGAQTALDKFAHKGVMSKWIEELPIED